MFMDRLSIAAQRLLKSDQNGIEIKIVACQFASVIILKSDQNGIEIFDFCPF